MRMLRFVLLTLAIVFAGACSGAPGASDGLPEASASLPGPSQATAATAAPTRVASQSSTVTAKGCGPSAIGLLDEGPFVTYEQQGHTFFSTILEGKTLVDSVDQVRVERIEPIFPTYIPGTRTIRAIGVLKAASQVSVLYGDQPVDLESWDAPFLLAGGIALNEQPFDGHDAAQVLGNSDRNSWPVQVGPNPAALVHADEIARDLRTFNLYWSDGPRQWILVGDVGPDLLIDMARSMYCT